MVDVSFEQKNTYRFGVDENEKYYCKDLYKYIRRREN